MFRSNSLQDLVGSLKHNDDPSFLASECRRLYTQPITKLTTEDLRLLIGQKIGLDHLVPVALGVLEKDPLVGGKLYSGDLLQSVASAPEEFWAANPALNNRLVEVKIEVECLAKTINEDLVPVLKNRKFL